MIVIGIGLFVLYYLVLWNTHLREMNCNVINTLFTSYKYHNILFCSLQFLQWSTQGPQKLYFFGPFKV